MKLENTHISLKQFLHPDQQIIDGWRKRILSSPINYALLHNLIKFQGNNLYKGEFLNVEKPNEDIENALLFMESPNTPEFGKRTIQLNYDQPVVSRNPPPSVPENERFAVKPKEFLEKVWLKIIEFQNSTHAPYWYNYKYSPELLSLNKDYKRNSQLVRSARERFGFNFQQGIRTVIRGYQKEMRRTGEPKWIHPVRAFLRSETAWIPRPPEYLYVAYAANLAEILHDANEDFENFKITEDYITFEMNNIKYIYPVNLTEKETAITNDVIDALSVPKDKMEEFKNDPVKLAQIQFTHLEDKLLKIFEKYPGYEGFYIALYTIWNKIEDRRDNIFSYWTLGNDGDSKKNHRQRLEDKLRETIHYFKHLEGNVNWLMTRLPPFSHNSEIGLKHSLYLDSIVNVCYLQLLGATYNDIFQKGIDIYKEEQKKTENNESEDGKLGFYLSFSLINLGAQIGEYSSCTLA